MNSSAKDHLVLIQIEGMHCHRCENAIQRALGAFPGVREVEVDFPSGQASVLHERGAVTAQQLMDAITDAGYRAKGYIERECDQDVEEMRKSSD
jgi:copper chaperone CopZ